MKELQEVTDNIRTNTLKRRKKLTNEQKRKCPSIDLMKEIQNLLKKHGYKIEEYYNHADENKFKIIFGKEK